MKTVNRAIAVSMLLCIAILSACSLEDEIPDQPLATANEIRAYFSGKTWRDHGLGFDLKVYYSPSGDVKGVGTILGGKAVRLGKWSVKSTANEGILCQASRDYFRDVRLQVVDIVDNFCRRVYILSDGSWLFWDEYFGITGNSPLYPQSITEGFVKEAEFIATKAALGIE